MPPPDHVAGSTEDGITPKIQGNSLLERLPDAELAALRAKVERVRSRMREVIFEQSQPIQYAYFPQSGVFSLLAQMQDGSMVETLTVGSEGMIGLSAVLGASRS
jgi:CRP-like cAMP-binding protein